MRSVWLVMLMMLSAQAVSQTLVASVEPLAKVLRGLYGDQVEVVTLLQANQNPHQLALSPRQAMLVQQHAFGWPNANCLKTILVRHRQNHSLDELFDLLIKPANVTVLFRGLLVHLHRLHSPVKLGG